MSIMTTPVTSQMSVIMNAGADSQGKLIKKTQNWTGLAIGLTTTYKEQAYNVLAAISPCLKYPVMKFLAMDRYELTEE